MHPTAALLALHGYAIMRHVDTFNNDTIPFRVKRQRADKETMLYMDLAMWGRTRSANLSKYTVADWEDIPDHLWDRLGTELIDHFLANT